VFDLLRSHAVLRCDLNFDVGVKDTCWVGCSVLGGWVLSSYPELLSTKAQRHLERLGVKVYTITRVTSVDADGIIVNGQSVPALFGAEILNRDAHEATRMKSFIPWHPSNRPL
jgi:hypothetical protein